MTSQQIRQQFIDFFVQKHGHTFVPSSPVVPHDDPTLLFTNAGMNQFKPIFLGQEKRAYTRAANTQKCIRAGGKHNDLDDVGRSRRHHTFFEMLGNWSFGDYFKRGAIEMAWELLTQVWKLDPTRLHVSCFEGDEKNGVPRDTEAADIWKQVAGLTDDHIHYFGKDNFWEMGDTGPCGPCTEIYYDRTPDKTGGKDVNGEDPRVMEIWNLVFIQYNRNADRSLTVLPAQHVDTGMGLERIIQVLQNVSDNYAIDLFNPFWDALTKLSGIKYSGQYPRSNAADPVAEAANPQLRHDIAFRVIADHIRCLTFALTDGAVPSNEGRGYVLRRILRRAVRFGRQQLSLKDPFLHTLVPVVVDAMGGAFAELKKGSERVAEIIKDEEVSFGRTLDRGIALFEEAATQAKVSAGIPRVRPYGSPSVNVNDEMARPDSRHLEIIISADDAFKLHDTYGFPIDLTRIMAEERGMTVDIAGYERLMEKAREIARAGGKEQETALTTMPPDAIAKLQGEKIPPTNDEPKFAGVDIQATIQAIWNGEKFVNEAQGADHFAVVLNHTNFYAEMGGQVGDQGSLIVEQPGTARSLAGTNAFAVQTTKVVAGYILHVGRVLNGKLRVGDAVTARLSPDRQLTQQNHTTTHLANWALRETLGDDVQQKGSLVDPEKLRFDFSHGKSMTEDEIAKVETLVARCIEQKLPVYAETAPQDQALKIHGLRAVFGEKYPPMVRVVSIGVPVKDLLADPANPKWRQYSIEFCGGTHLTSSADAAAFAITSEESVSKGIRRIVALTGDAARQATAAAADLDSQVAKARALPEPQLPQQLATVQKAAGGSNLPLRARRRAQAAIGELQAKYKTWEKANKVQAAASNVDAVAVAGELLNAAPSLQGGKVVVGEIAGATDDQLRSAIDSLKKKSPSLGALLAAVADGKISFIACVSDDLIAKGLKAGDWVKETAKVAGGGGGGRPQMAQAGGKDPTKLPDALERAKAFASERLK
jgi:alanyl-tRNA synthetase